MWRLGEVTGDEKSGVRQPVEGLLWRTKWKGLSHKYCLSLEEKSPWSMMSSFTKWSMFWSSSDWLVLLEVSKSKSKDFSDQTSLLGLSIWLLQQELKPVSQPHFSFIPVSTIIISCPCSCSRQSLWLDKFPRPTGEFHLRISFTETLAPWLPVPISWLLVLLRWVSFFNKVPNKPNPLFCDLVFGDEDCFCTLTAASRRSAAVLAGMCRKIALGLLQGLLGGEHWKRGDFLGSGEFWNEKRQTFLQKRFWEMGFRFLTCTTFVFGILSLWSWQRLSAM